MKIAHSLIKKLDQVCKLEFPLPCNCIVCRLPLYSKIGLCGYCKNKLPWINVSCKSCGIPMMQSLQDSSICGACVKKPPPFTSCNAIFTYRSPVNKLLADFKYRAGLAEGRVLATLLCDKFIAYYAGETGQINPRNYPQKLIPVPLHKHRLLGRGFNQATEIAKTITKYTGVATSSSLLIRKRNTKPQSQLDAQARTRNLKSAFALVNRNALENFKHVALVDDVVTTTATITAISGALKHVGIERIDVWAIARASHQI